MPTETNVDPPLDPEAIAERIRERLRRLMKAAALDVNRKVIMANPVDTGYSRANWRVSVNEVDNSVSRPPSPQERAANKNNKGWYRGEGASIPQINADTQDTIFVTNSVHYMRQLEEGSSKQAPAHFIKNIAMEVQSNIRRYIAEAKT